MLTNRNVSVDKEGRPRDYLGNHASAFLVGHMPEKDKGLPGGSCNRTSCQRPNAVFKHASNGAYYCWECAGAINRACMEDPHWKPIVYDRSLAETVDEDMRDFFELIDT